MHSFAYGRFDRLLAFLPTGLHQSSSVSSAGHTFYDFIQAQLLIFSVHIFLVQNLSVLHVISQTSVRCGVSFYTAQTVSLIGLSTVDLSSTVILPKRPIWLKVSVMPMM